MRLAHVLSAIAAAVVSAPGCSNQDPITTTVGITPDAACHFAYDVVVGGAGYDCKVACPGSSSHCTLDSKYQEAYDLQNVPDGGTKVPIDAGDPTGVCPAWPSQTVDVTCTQYFGNGSGRRSIDVADPSPSSAPGVGDYLAGCAYLEAASVHAFGRLARELKDLGAPAALVASARAARRDELRHARVLTRLARRFGAVPAALRMNRSRHRRSLLDVATENAIEGCVRETYGAALNLLQARSAHDIGVRRAMRAIAADECRHARLAWAVSAWALPQLTDGNKRSDSCCSQVVSCVATCQCRTAMASSGRSMA
jgi:hypothetical protein